jgi:preprotein translocase subunit SecA
VAWHYSGRRKEVFTWFEALFRHYLENFQNEEDALLLGDAISEVANLRAPDLLDTIETLFREDLVDTSVCGSLLQVQGDMYEPVKSWAKMPIKSLQNMYQHFTDTWDIYSDAGDEDDAKLLAGGSLLRGKEKSKGLSAFHPNGQPVTKEDKTGRNELCPCGSGKKYKKCHGA